MGSRKLQPVGTHPGFPATPPPPDCSLSAPSPHGSVLTRLPTSPPNCPFFSLDPLSPSRLLPPPLSLEWA